MELGFNLPFPGVDYVPCPSHVQGTGIQGSLIPSWWGPV